MPRARKPIGPEITALVVTIPGEPAQLVPARVAAAAPAMLQTLETIAQLSTVPEIVGLASVAIAAAKGPR
jgi:hypothetical protein